VLINEIKIKGHSGCEVVIINRDGESCIRKSTSDEKYIPRLQAQIKKQKFFNIGLQPIKVPEVYEEFHSNNGYTVEMEYAKGLDIFTYMESSSKAKIDTFVSVIMNLLIIEINLSEKKSFPKEIVLAKVYSIYNDYGFKNHSTISECCDRIIDIVEKSTFKSIPIGRCHGDLTFSNILVSRNGEAVYLIDFLDSFIESPIQDIVKLKQDTMYHWSMLKYEGVVDRVRISIIFKYIDNIINNFIKFAEIELKTIYVFQVVNLLRIIPYTKDSKLTKYLLDSINTELLKLEQIK
jgi:hypothetical protein